MDQVNGRNKMGQHARNFRLVSRGDIFQQRRKTYDDLDYLGYYHPHTKQAILQSMQTPLPNPLPPLAPETISLYRRSSQPVFLTRNHPQTQLEGHMTYESLWILCSLDEKQFEDYPAVVKEFERDLSLYLSAHSKDIYQMAVTAAGNKILGKEADILALVQKDSRQLWVLVNHIYQNKIPCTRLFPFLSPNNEFAFKTLYELSIILDEITEEIMAQKPVIESILASVNAENESVRKYAMRVIGSMIAVKETYTVSFSQSKLLDFLLVNLSCSNGEVRRDAAWLVSNLCTKKAAANIVICHAPLVAKLVDLFAFEAIYGIKKELTYTFCYLAHFADPKSALVLLGHPNMLEICYGQLCVEEVDLNEVTLLLLKELLELGDIFKYEEGDNLVLSLVQQARALCNEISNKSYSENSEVSSISLQILSFLEEDDD